MNRELLRTLILNREPLTYSWVGGFHQAEGSFTLAYDTYPRWSIGQKDSQVIHNIREWLNLGRVRITSHKNNYITYLQSWNKHEVLEISRILTPYLWFNKKDQANEIRIVSRVDPINLQEKTN